jgi:hypothetical protein
MIYQTDHKSIQLVEEIEPASDPNQPRSTRSRDRNYLSNMPNQQLVVRRIRSIRTGQTYQTNRSRFNGSEDTKPFQLGKPAETNSSNRSEVVSIRQIKPMRDRFECRKLYGRSSMRGNIKAQMISPNQSEDRTELTFRALKTA